MFGVPRLARRSKPFIDHVISFSILDNKIWFRNYQIIEKDPGKGSLAEVEEKEGGKKSKSRYTEQEQPTLIEIGPRMVLTPIRIFEGSFGGATVYENPGEAKDCIDGCEYVLKIGTSIQNTSRQIPQDMTFEERKAISTRTERLPYKIERQRHRSWQMKLCPISLVGRRSLLNLYLYIHLSLNTS